MARREQSIEIEHMDVSYMPDREKEGFGLARDGQKNEWRAGGKG